MVKKKKECKISKAQDDVGSELASFRGGASTKDIKKGINTDPYPQLTALKKKGFVGRQKTGKKIKWFLTPKGRRYFR